MFHILFYIISAIAILFVAAIAGILIVHFTRYAINPAYRKKMNAEADELIEERKQKKQAKNEARLRHQRALNSMTTTERLLYEQNKELNRIHWYLTLRDLFAPRHRR